MTSHDEEAKKAKTRKHKQKEIKTNENKINQNHNVLPTVRVFVGHPGRRMALGRPAPRGRITLYASCGLHTLQGSYLFATHGWNIVGGVAQPKAIVEGIDFNGDGTLVSPFATVSINGMIIRSNGSLGSYTVNPDCTGTLAFTGGASFDIFIQPAATGFG